VNKADLISRKTFHLLQKQNMNPKLPKILWTLQFWNIEKKTSLTWYREHENIHSCGL